MITGAPMIGVTAFKGMIPFSPGSTQIILHNNDMAAPVRIVPGIKYRWLSVLRNILAICGTASPIKAIGPQYAVVTAVSRPVTINRQLRSLIVFIPRFSAYCSPSKIAFKGLIRSNEQIRPAIVTTANIGI